MTDKEIQKREDDAYELGISHGRSEALDDVKRGEALPEYRAAYDAQKAKP